MSFRKYSALIRFASAGACAIVLAGCAGPHANDRDIDAEARPIFRRMCDFMDGAKSLRFHLSATMDRPADTGQLAQFHRTSDILMVRPDKLYAVTDSDDGKWSVWYRGTSLTVLDRDENRYAIERVAGRIGEMLDYMADEYDLVMPMADVLGEKTYDSLLENVEWGEYLGKHAIGATQCHHLMFHQDNIDWQIWIDAGNQPWPRKLVITYTQERDHPQYVAEMDDWTLSPQFTDSTFRCTPPSGSSRVSMAELVDREDGREMP